MVYSYDLLEHTDTAPDPKKIQCPVHFFTSAGRGALVVHDLGARMPYRYSFQTVGTTSSACGSISVASRAS